MRNSEKRSFAILCLLGTLEKLGFNGVRALLVLYVTRELLFTDGAAFNLYAALMSLGYLTPLWVRCSRACGVTCKHAGRF